MRSVQLVRCTEKIEGLRGGRIATLYVCVNVRKNSLKSKI